MEIESYNKNNGWRAGNLNTLIQRIHDTLMQEGMEAYIGGVVSLSNVTFKIQKNRDSPMMDANVMDRDGERGLNFLKQEFKEWVAEEYNNPGKAWKEYPERWRHFLDTKGRVDYSYNERINRRGQLNRIISSLVDHPTTRQAYLSIYHPDIDSQRIGSGMMIPCILGYQFTQIGQDLNMTVMARSIDANNCLMNDMWLADRLLNHVVETINRRLEYAASKKISEGSITFMISNLHSYPDVVPKETTR